MSYAIWLVPVGLAMGLVGLLAFLWSMKSGQLEDLDGAAARVLLEGAAGRPLKEEPPQPRRDAGANPGTGGPRSSLQNHGNKGSSS